MRFAVISDVHGNVPALEAVLEDIGAQGTDAVLCLGDHVSGPIDPAGAADRLMALGGPMVRGNHDRWVCERDDKALGVVDRFTRAQLSPRHMEWLRRLPATAVFADEIFLCHGTPGNDSQTWLDEFFRGRDTTLPSYDAVDREAQGLDYPVMLCGHTHVARSVRLYDGRLVINPGAVGLQLVHGSPDARYAIIERRNGRWLTSLRVVEYDHKRTGETAGRNGFPGWQNALTTGWVGLEALD